MMFDAEERLCSSRTSVTSQISRDLPKILIKSLDGMI